MKDGFARVAYGTPPGTASSNAPKLLSRTEGVTLQTAAEWHNAVSLSPSDGEATFGVFHLNRTDHLLAHATPTEDGPLYIYTRVPNTYLREWRGNIDGLRRSLASSPAMNGTLPPAERPTPSALSTEAARDALMELMERMGKMGAVLSLVDGVVRRERLLIYNAPPSQEVRLGVVAGLIALLPVCARADLTFSTQVAGQHTALNGRVVFAEQQRASKRYQYNWETRAFAPPPPPDTRSSYVAQLAAAWDDNPDTMLAFIAGFDPLVDCTNDTDLISRLNEITARYTFDQRVQGEAGEVTLGDLKTALGDPDGLPQAWRDRYAGLLLERALDEKDTEAHSLIAGEMDQHDELDTSLNERLRGKLTDTPDLVYVFIRQRLSESASERWQARLQEAAAASLDVAFDSGDPELILSWLRLLAREPNSFGLGDVVETGMRRALPYAYEDSTFALNLLLLSVRFAAETLDNLLDDEKLLAALDNDVRDAFAYYERDALAELQTHGPSLFLAGMGRAAGARAGAAFEAGVIERIWALYQGEKKYNTRSPYTPATILQTCAETGANWLPSTAVETLLGLLLRHRDDDLYDVYTEHLAAETILVDSLPNALLRGGREVNAMLDAITPLAATGRLSAQDTLAVYVAVLDSLEWADETQPMIQAVGRVLSQNSSATLAAAQLDTLLTRSGKLQDEPTCRIAALALLDDAAEVEEDDELIERVKRVFSHLAWSNTARNAALQRWRRFIQAQPSARLSRLEDGLKGVRVMEDAYETLRSVTALRRLIGGRDVKEFAEAINTAYEVMQTLAESFEPDERGSDIGFDPETVRATLMEMSNQLTPHQQQILGNSLKGLAGLIAQMGDNRTKAGLTRRNTSLDRQLITGEQMPGGAVDAMKWMAGVFSGAQADADDEDD